MKRLSWTIRLTELTVEYTCEERGRELHFYVPMAPNTVSGTYEITQETRDSGWLVKAAY